MTLTRTEMNIWLHIKGFCKLMPINGYEMYQSGRLIVGVDWSESEVMIFTYEHAGKGKIIPLQEIEKFTDVNSLINKIKSYLDKRDI